MAKFGLERREVVKDNLAGQADIKPVFLRGSGITAPRRTAIQPSPAMGLINALGEFADLCQTTRIVATATEKLAREIIDALAS